MKRGSLGAFTLVILLIAVIAGSPAISAQIAQATPVILTPTPIQVIPTTAPTIAPVETVAPTETAVPAETVAPIETAIPAETVVPSETAVPVETTVPSVVPTIDSTVGATDEPTESTVTPEATDVVTETAPVSTLPALPPTFGAATAAVTPDATDEATDVAPVQTVAALPPTFGAATAAVTPDATDDGGWGTPDAAGTPIPVETPVAAGTPVADGTPIAAGTPVVPTQPAATPRMTLRSAAIVNDAEQFAAADAAAPVDFGQASDFNVFVLGDYNATTSDVEGCLAVGGNVTFTGGFSVGGQAQGCQDALVTGGNLTFPAGTISNGNVVYGGTLTGNPTVPNGTISNGTTTYFDEAEEYFDALSDNLASQPANGTFTSQYGSTTFTGTSTSINVFNVTAADLNGIHGMTINAPAGSTVIINVSGDNVTFTGYQQWLNGVDASHVIFNFPDATTITTTGFGFEGSLLAPNATYNFSNGQHNGQIVVRNLTGNGESHNHPFTGNFPPPPSTPTPVPTSTPTKTPVPTSTPTKTPVPTSTPTNTPVPTSTPTNTPVPTSTPTNTPVPTSTPTNTPVPTSTPTNTPVPTSTPTNTPVPTSTPTNTPV
ncbi:MAG TPA: choice-of-anchor A family protein, partial [Thermomicrobiales bacterium]|nr:choice-of-anchor A family protein [Thermomicrobiales bacterium]